MEVKLKPIVLVAHNAKFELGWLLRYGYDLSSFLPWDTMIAEYVLAGNRDWDLSLDATAKRYGLPAKDPVIDGMMKAGICPSEMPERWLLERVKYDATTTRAIAARQYIALKERGLLPVFFTRCIVTPVLAGIESVGMRVDAHRVGAEYEKQVHARRNASDLLNLMTGGINMRSRPQLAEFLYDKLKFEELTDRNGEPVRTPSGLRATDADSLDRLKARTKEQREFLKLQKALGASEARLSKALEVFKTAAEDHAGLLYGNFNQCVTQTHRLSSSAKRLKGRDGKERGAQFQNLPREYKKLFRPHEDGRVLTECDYSQLEFRIAVELAHDHQGREDILSGHDVHKFTASVLKNKDMTEVTKEERQDAKPDTFKPLYYGQSGTARQRAYYAAFRERYPKIAEMQEKWIADAVWMGQQVTASGLIYYWPDARRGRTGYVNGSPSICNYPIQAFATADIVLIGLAYMYWRLEGEDAMIVNTVHDSVVIDHAPQVDIQAIARNAMIKDVLMYVDTVYGRQLWVPLQGEYVTSPHWADYDEATSSGTFDLGG
jgi:DNA polymerase-1